MWAIGPERIRGFKHIPVLMALATSGAMIAAVIGVNSAWNRRFGYRPLPTLVAMEEILARIVSTSLTPVGHAAGLPEA